jgi:hypothetical protein
LTRFPPRLLLDVRGTELCAEIYITRVEPMSSPNAT